MFKINNKMGVYEGLKDAAGVLKEAGKIEQYRQILEAQEKLLEMQKRVSELETENKQLEEKLEIKEHLTFEKNSYWYTKDNQKHGPLCSCCWDDERKLIRMQPQGNPAYYRCPKCKTDGIQVYPERNNPPRASVHMPDYI